MSPQPGSSIGYRCALLAGLLLLAGAPRAAEPIRLIVQGDDMGAAHAVNVATIEAYTDGIVRSANVIVNAPWTPEAARLLREHPDLDAGVHLTLTSEWTSIKWRPLTEAPSLVDRNGYFFPMVWPSDAFPPGSSLKEASPELQQVERELRAQIELARRLVPHLSYAWEHMGFGSLAPPIRATVERLAREYGLVIPGPGIGVQYLRSVYVRQDGGEVRARKLAARLRSLEPGTWLIVDHAAIDDEEMRAIGHPGYEDVAADRAAVLAAWTHPLVAEAIRARGIELSNYRALKHVSGR